jgi:hypothetical protein
VEEMFFPDTVLHLGQPLLQLHQPPHLHLKGGKNAVNMGTSAGTLFYYVTVPVDIIINLTLCARLWEMKKNIVSKCFFEGINLLTEFCKHNQL